jgi:hypothetical protein
MIVQTPQRLRQPGPAAAARAVPPVLMFGIGAPKCGTTWMHRYLAAHPDCHFRALKELHYFDTLNDLGFAWILELLEKRVVTLESYVLHVEGDERERALRELVDCRDYLKLMNQRIDDRFGYSRFLLHGKGTKRLVGDITPAYARLPVPVLKEMAGMTAQTRFVYLMREPVERLWSHIRMAVEHENVAPQDFERRCQDLMADELAGRCDPKRPLIEYSDYAGTVARLSEAVPREKVLVMCYEHLMTRKGVRRLCSFLGIRHVEPDLGRAVNAGKRASSAVERLPSRSARYRKAMT